MTDDTRPTTFKKRYVVESQKLFRVSRLEEQYINTEVENLVISELEKSTKDAHGIVVSDFVYGVITPRILECIYEISEERDLLLFGDLQCSSQVGSVLRYKNFHYYAQMKEKRG